MQSHEVFSNNRNVFRWQIAAYPHCAAAEKQCNYKFNEIWIKVMHIVLRGFCSIALNCKIFSWLFGVIPAAVVALVGLVGLVGLLSECRRGCCHACWRCWFFRVSWRRISCINMVAQKMQYNLISINSINAKALLTSTQQLQIDTHSSSSNKCYNNNENDDSGAYEAHWQQRERELQVVTVHKDKRQPNGWNFVPKVVSMCCMCVCMCAHMYI